MKQLIFSLLAVGVLLATAATTAAQTKDHSFTLGVGLSAHNDNIGWATTNSYDLGRLGIIGIDVLYPFKEEGASILYRAGLKFNTGRLVIEPNIVASYEEEFRFGIGLGSEYFLGESFALFLRGFLTYTLHPQQNGVIWDDSKIAVLGGIVIKI